MIETATSSERAVEDADGNTYRLVIRPYKSLGRRGAIEEDRHLVIGRNFRSFVHSADHAQLDQLPASSPPLQDAREVRLVLTLVPVQIWARASAKKSAVLHVTLVDLRSRE